MDQPVDQPTQQPEWFENLIAHYDTQNPQVGDVLQATVIRSDQEGFFLDLGLKREVVVPLRDLEHVAKELLDSLTPGTIIPVVVTSVATESREMEVSLSRGLEHQLWDKAKTSLENGEILTLEIVDHNRGGLIVLLDNLRGFVPFSLVPDLRGVRNPKRAESIKKGMVGKTIDVKITELDPERRRLILSAESAQAELRQRKLESFRKGQTLTGKIVKVVDFGAFVDLGGIDGLIHVSQLSWKKVKHPSEQVKVGDEVDVKIIEIDHERQRIGLSRKALLPGPWQTLSEELKAGDYIEGIVTRLVEFGAFAKLPQGIEGLIHTSQIGYSSHQDPQNAIKPGDRVLLKVLDVKPDKKRVALSMRQVPIERQISWAMENIELGETDTSAEPAQSQALEGSVTGEMQPVTVEVVPVLVDEANAVPVVELESEAVASQVIPADETKDETEPAAPAVELIHDEAISPADEDPVDDAPLDEGRIDAAAVAEDSADLDLSTGSLGQISEAALPESQNA